MNGWFYSVCAWLRGGVGGTLCLGFAASAAADAFVSLEQVSAPLGLCGQSAMLPLGSSVPTLTAPTPTQGYRFSCWTVNGAEQRDLVGRAANPSAPFTLTDNTTAVAHYYLESLDADTNSIPDWWEYEFLGALSGAAGGDSDGDGFGLTEEYRRDYHPAITNEIRDGGLSLTLSPNACVVLDARLSTYTLCSQPLGLLASVDQVLGNGTVISVSEVSGASNGYSFACWTLNGVRLSDVAGRSLSACSFVLQSNTVAVAHFVPTEQDGDGDGVPDWYELNLCGTTIFSAASDADGDGFSLAEEYRRDSHPAIVNEIRDGGFSLVMGPSFRAIADVRLSAYRQSSEPLGFVAAVDQVLSNGTAIVVPDLYGASNGYHFAGWTLNGARLTDAAGRALSALQFTLQSNTTAVAHFVPTGQDGDGDGVPDWFELNLCGTTHLSAASDSDGDGFSLAEEYRRDYHPAVANEIRDGGFSIVAGPLARVLLAGGLSEYRQYSAPLGLLASVGQVLSNGTAITVPDVYGTTNGYRFAYWTLNDERQEDAVGRARGNFRFVLQTNTAAVAHYLPESEDGDADGLPDWYEHNLAGSTNWNGGSDPDGDGFDLAEEYRRDYHPLLPNDIRDGGFALVMSRQVLVNLSFYPRVTDVLVDGQLRPFFSASTTSTGLFSVAANSHPALGDWDGDGDLDLFVGGSNGVMRVFENAGSPVVINWVERTGDFMVLATCWTNTPNPAPSLGDWNGDGLADLAVGGATGTVWLAASPGSWTAGALAGTTPTRFNTDGPAAVPALADVSGDGQADLLVLTEAGAVRCYTNTLSITVPFAAPPCSEDLLGYAVPGGRGLAVADIDADGAADVLVSDQRGRIWEFRGNGSGAYTLRGNAFGGTFDGFAERLTITAGDTDGDGDTDVIGGYARGGLVYLQNPEAHLEVSPPTATVMPGGALTLAALRGAGPVRWALIRNGSGGSVASNSGDYIAGAVGGVWDCVEGTDASGRRGRCYINVVSPEEAERCGKAVIIAGRVSSTDPLWPCTQYLADHGYNMLRYKGYARQNIRYLSPATGDDVDGDGLANDIAGASTWANAAHTFTNWVGDSGRLFVYLVDHGGASEGVGRFRLNAQESLSAKELDGWLDALQDRNTNEVVVVIDCCDAGSFLPWLSYDGPAKRIVIAACGPDEPTVFAAGGLVSFSEAFFDGLMWGLSVGWAFDFAGGAMAAYQAAGLDDTGDGVSDSNDGASADTVWIGADDLSGKDVPQVEGVMPTQHLSGNTVATLWAENVASTYPVRRVWCLVVPPSHQPNPADPVIDLPQLELTYNPVTRRYEAQYAGFSEEGVYKIVYYAKDIWESVSLPKQSYVIQDGFKERAVIVAGGSANDPLWSSIDAVSHTVSRVLLERRIATNAICFLSQALSENVSGLSGRSAFADAVTNWASGCDKLTLCLVAASAGPEGSFLLNETETVKASELAGLLAASSISNVTVSVILDFEGAGAWLPTLAATGRVCVASTQEGQPAIFLNGGLLSFSWCFFSGVLAGQNVWDAFVDAEKLIRVPGGKKQSPQLDSDADGRFVPGLDKIAAKRLFLGSAFMTGADVPTIDAVTPDTVLTSPDSLTLWASGVADIGGVSNVFCLLSSPEDEALCDARRFDMTESSVTERFEVPCSAFTSGGTYACTYFVTDNEGQLSMPRQTLVEVASADAYETDNGAGQASALEVGFAQAHNLHEACDEDWVRFYAPSGTIFKVQATQRGTNSDLRLEMYREKPDGTLEGLGQSNQTGAGDGLAESFELRLAGESPASPGFYCVRVESADDRLWGAGSGYDLEVSCGQTAGAALIVVAVDTLNGSVPPGAVAAWDVTNSTAFGSANSLQLAIPAGVHTVRVTTADGYLPVEDPRLRGQVGNPDSSGYGNPRRTRAVLGSSPRMAVFQFVPVNRVTGQVVNRFTGEPAVGVQLAFRASGGPLHGLTYDGYPFGASYRDAWVTLSDGSFPTNVWLPTASWSLIVAGAGYSDLDPAAAIAMLPAGAVTNIGALLLTPCDLNGNGVDDAWEQRYRLTGMTGSGDADGDGSSDRDEYLAGTDPTNSLSVFQILEMARSPGSTLQWKACGGRSYRVFWSSVPGAWQTGQSVRVGTTNVWTDTASPQPPARFYRVNVELPQ